MGNYCGKCGCKKDTRTGLCPNCDAGFSDDQFEQFLNDIKNSEFYQQKQNTSGFSENGPIQNDAGGRTAPQSNWYPAQAPDLPKRRAKKQNNRMLYISLIIFSAGLVISALILWPVLSKAFSSKTKINSDTGLAEINSACVSYEITSDSGETALLEVEIPDYAKLYKDAWATGNPDQYIKDALLQKKYDSRKYSIEASVTIENGEKVIHSEEAVKKLIEHELLTAVDGIMEG